MKIFLYSILLSIVFDSFTNAKASSKGRNPNVIIVLSDDQGYGDFSCHGNPVLLTPTLDKLYSESVRFSNFHVAPQCTPTRGQLMTGLDAMNNKASVVGKGSGIMRRDIATMAEIFQDNGYQTGIFGKWHLGDTYPDRPMERGFDKSIWFKGWGLLSEAEYDNDYYATRYLDSLGVNYSGEYCSDLWFRKSMDWMEEMVEKGEKFFTYLSLNNPHGPFYAPKKDFDEYKNKVDDSKTASFFGMIQNIDKNMAKLEDWLDRKNLNDNTIIIYMNDNGGTAGVDLYNAGMRGKKGSVYDGGHRAACFIRWPAGNLIAPESLDYACQVQDILPTLIDLIGMKIDLSYDFDGKSLGKMMTTGKRPEKDRMFVVQFGTLENPDKYNGCVVWNSWRLVGGNELYNIENDPGQTQNIWGGNTEIVNKMKAYYDSWWERMKKHFNHFESLVVGSEYENPVVLTSDFWLGKSVNTQWHVAQAAGEARGGDFKIFVEENGSYNIELSRWPFHLDRDLTSRGPEKSIGGKKINQGKALPIAFGCVALNDGEVTKVKSKVGASKIPLNIRLSAGEHLLQAWFEAVDGKSLCGSYYVKLEKN